MTPLRKITLMVALAAVSGGQAVMAEDDVMLDELVVTGTRSETSLRDLAGNTGKVSEEEIDLINADHIEESLARVSGVNIQRGNGAESLVALRSPVLTGPGAAGAFLFMEDGISLRAPGFSNNNGLAEAHYEWAGGIEVVRGPGSALYGSNAVHGLINVLSRAPSLDLEREIDFTFGSDDLYKVKGTVSDTVGAHGYRVSFSGTDFGGWRDDEEYGQQKITARHDYFSPNGDSFKTVFSAFNLNQETAGFIRSDDDEAYKDSSLMKTNEDPDAFRDWWSVRLSTRWEHEMANGNMLSITPYLRNNRMEFRQHYLPSRAIEENEHTSIGTQIAYYLDLDGGHKIILGTDLEYTDGSLKETQQLASFSFFGKNRQQGVHYDFDVEATTIAPYIHAEWQLAEKWRATTGLRFEHVRYDYNNNVADGTGEADGSACFAAPAECLFLRPADRDDTFNDWSPKLGLVYKVTENHSLFANYARGHRAPQTTDLYRLQNQQLVGDLDSEKADSIEVGMRGNAGIVNYDISAFYMKKKNFFFRDPDGLNVTDGRTRHKGIETALSMPMGEQFDLAANYTYARHTYDFDNVSSGTESGNEIDTAPRHIANVRLGWNFKPQNRAELEWVHMGDYFLDSANENE
ncbi:TonB-dependent receptor, partial [Methylophaga sp. OBS4]|uniref:TonB-dependent receptor n=1 Tax=Methylophaga sp. OBS4 TaxID=2991935 RepID=UPI00224E21C6